MNALGFLIGAFMVWLSKSEAVRRDGEWFWPYYLSGMAVMAVSLYLGATQGFLGN